MDRGLDRLEQPSLRTILPAPSSSASTTSEFAPMSMLRYSKRRAPITNIACQECRRRKTKCDGERPRCANCARRGMGACEYEVDGNPSSRMAAYKSRIEQQDSRIEQLEYELTRLRDSSQAGSTERSSPTSTHASPMANGSKDLPLLPQVLQSQLTDGRRSELEFDARRREVAEQEVVAFGQAQLVVQERAQKTKLLRSNHMLQTENDQLKQLLGIIATMNERPLAHSLAARIQANGVTDQIAAEVNHHFAAGRLTGVPPGFGSAPQMAMGVPAIAVPTHTPPVFMELDPVLQEYHPYHYPHVPDGGTGPQWS